MHHLVAYKRQIVSIYFDVRIKFLVLFHYINWKIWSFSVLCYMVLKSFTMWISFIYLLGMFFFAIFYAFGCITRLHPRVAFV
jgi:hypothetical protein